MSEPIQSEQIQSKQILPKRIPAFPAATAFAVLLLASATAFAQQTTPARDGVAITANGATLQVTALRDDILRVRMWRGDARPEDASWAVLPAARTSSVPVAPEAHGFATKSLRVSVDDQLRLTVMDLQGNLLQKDAAPVQWEGNRFNISKERTSSDHFFGLGDKPGPLDRGGQAFTMWNTDAFGWQESTDPIYKSIPYFLDVNRGRALGVFLDKMGICFTHTATRYCVAMIPAPPCQG